MQWQQKVIVKQLMLKKKDGPKVKLLLMRLHSKEKMERKLKYGLIEIMELDHKLLLKV
jgi:hypothetical protein